MTYQMGPITIGKRQDELFVVRNTARNDFNTVTFTFGELGRLRTLIDAAVQDHNPSGDCGVAGEEKDIPKDILATAKQITDGMDDRVKDFDFDEIELVIAKAILAERERWSPSPLERETDNG